MSDTATSQTSAAQALPTTRSASSSASGAPRDARTATVSSEGCAAVEAGAVEEHPHRRWHSGQFFLIQDERAVTGTAPFDTLSIIGWDAERGCYFARTFENHGFQRCYDVTVDGRVWTFSGATERARIVFSDDGATQTITWEWRPEEGWLPLCDRIATKVR